MIEAIRYLGGDFAVFQALDIRLSIAMFSIHSRYRYRYRGICILIIYWNKIVQIDNKRTITRKYIIREIYIQVQYMYGIEYSVRRIAFKAMLCNMIKSPKAFTKVAIRRLT